MTDSLQALTSSPQVYLSTYTSSKRIADAFLGRPVANQYVGQLTITNAISDLVIGPGLIGGLVFRVSSYVVGNLSLEIFIVIFYKKYKWI